jgi:superfamily II DNA helicase RecQ
VISPLISLIQDQVRHTSISCCTGEAHHGFFPCTQVMSLTNLGIPAAHLGANTTQEDAQNIYAGG